MRTLKILTLALIPGPVFALAGAIGSPSIGYPGTIEPAKKKKVTAVLEFLQKELQFLEGRFINEFSNQRFGESSAQVRRAIELLKDAEVWNVSVHFRDFGEQDSAFSLDQNTSKNSLRVMVNSGRRDFKLHDFKAWLPEPELLKG